MRKLPPKAIKNSSLEESATSREKPASTKDNGKSKDTKMIKTDKAVITKHKVKSEDSKGKHSENPSKDDVKVKEFAGDKTAKEKENPPSILKIKTQSLSDYDNKSVKTSMIKVSVSADSIKKEKDLSQANLKVVNSSQSELLKTKNVCTQGEIIKSDDHVKPINTKKGKIMC